MPHGEACAFTLPAFWVHNATNAQDDGRLEAISRELGFNDAHHLAQAIEKLKAHLQLRTTWAELGVTTDAELQRIVDDSFSGNMLNNPVAFTLETLFEFYKGI